ncbi:MAG: SAM-dependent DNA methyltransferase [Anaerolineae bacterium]|nr:SAM-dependent DNA methyltransferase [Anaerolineae bacterium]
MPDKQHTFGQFETPPDVADLLLGFCLRRPTDRLLDPSCGEGAFLLRAAQWLDWLTDGRGDIPAEALWGIELDAETAVSAQQSLPQAHITNQNFFATNLDGERPFDAIIGNPPYTRAEWLGKLHEDAGEQLALFAEAPVAELVTSTSSVTGSVTGSVTAVSETDEAQLLMPASLWHSLGGRSGLHAYFFLHGTEFLREGGRFGFVVPNAWLDVAYGERLKQYLLDHYKILAIIESDVERWFSDAKINTCLIILEKCSGPNRRAANLVRLVRLKRPLTALIPFPLTSYQRQQAVERLVTRLLPSVSRTNDEAAICVLAQHDLRPAAKWGLLLRAPAVVSQPHVQASLRPLKSWATVQRGFTTGANDFFYLDAKTIETWQIEPEFRRPLLKSLRGLTHLTLSAADCKHELLWIPPDAQLTGTAVSRYLTWGEQEGIHQHTTCAVRQPWYSLPPQPAARLILPKGIWRRHMAPLLAESLLVDQQLYQIQLPPDIQPEVAAALLNSAWFALQCELHGRINFGAGVLWLAAYELGRILLPDPRALSAPQAQQLAALFTELAKRPFATTEDHLSHPTRQALDNAVFDLIGLNEGERTAVLASLQERIQARKK